MISSRFIPVTCVLLALALVPTLIHSYAGVLVVDTRSTAAIPETLGGFSSTPTGRNATWGKRKFDSDDWIERRYASAGDEVVLTVVRSYDLKTLYHHPELAIADETPYTESAVMRFESNESIPVHVLRSNTGERAGALYVLHYDDRFVENPIRFQMRTAGELLLSGRKPMTLFFARHRVTSGSEREQAAASGVLFSAIERFLAGPDAVLR